MIVEKIVTQRAQFIQV